MKQIIVLFISLFAVLALANYQGHYDDKGYRLCLHAVETKYAYPQTVKACVMKYADLNTNTE